MPGITIGIGITALAVNQGTFTLTVTGFVIFTAMLAGSIAEIGNMGAGNIVTGFTGVFVAAFSAAAAEMFLIIILGSNKIRIFADFANVCIGSDTLPAAITETGENTTLHTLIIIPAIIEITAVDLFGYALAERIRPEGGIDVNRLS